MGQCIACNKNLGMLNTPMFSKGNTKDGGTVCTSCHMKLALRHPSVSNKINEHTSADIIERLKKAPSDNKRLDEIQEQIKKINPALLHKVEVGELPTILMQDEIIENVVGGFLQEGKGSTGHGLLVATNLRLVFIDKSSFGFGLKMEDFPYDKITSVSVETGLFKSNLKIICSGNTALINVISGAKELSEFVRQKTLTKPQAQPIQQQSQGEDVIAQIEKLAALKDKGILSEQEFADKKAELLAKL